MINLEDYVWLKIEPVDAWFFRDGRPSNRGEDQSDLESEFPPNASTVVGGLRAAFARSHGWNGRGSWRNQLKDNVNDVLGDGFDDLGQLSFLGPLLMRHDGLLWPMPRHVAGQMVEDHFQPTLLLAPSSEPVATDLGLLHLPTLPSDWKVRQSHVSGLNDQQKGRPPESRSDVWVTTSGMSKILSGRVPDRDDCLRSKDLFEHESRIGIHRSGRDSQFQNGSDDREESPSMYSPRYVRLKPNVALAMAIRGMPDGWSVPPLLPLGGESRLAGVETLKITPVFPEATPTTNHSIVISVTPARFDHQWWGAGPGDDASKLCPTLSGSIVATALERPLRIGGWDSVKGQPRPLTPFAPAGTVWWMNPEASSQCGFLQIGNTQHTKYGNGVAFLSAGIAEFHS